MIFPNGTLRVVSPVTEDGNRPKIVDGMPVYKETFLPKTAKRALDRQNNNLPNHLKKKIEIVDEGTPAKKLKSKPGPKPRPNAQTN